MKQRKWNYVGFDVYTKVDNVCVNCATIDALQEGEKHGKHL